MAVQNINSLYPGVPPFSYLMMQPAEIFSEEVRAVLTRLQARDLFDTYFLVSQGCPTDVQMIEQKLKYCKRTFDKAEYRDRLIDIAPLWKAEMELIVMGKLPPIDSVIEAVESVASTWH